MFSVIPEGWRRKTPVPQVLIDIDVTIERARQECELEEGETMLQVIQ